MKRNVSGQYREESQAVLEALAEENAWDLAVQIWDGKPANQTRRSKVLVMKKNESAARSIVKPTTQKREVIMARKAAA